MALKKRKPQQVDPVAELLRDLLIVELAKAGVPQLDIRRLVGCDVHRVSRFAKLLKKAKNQAAD